MMSRSSWIVGLAATISLEAAGMSSTPAPLPRGNIGALIVKAINSKDAASVVALLNPDVEIYVDGELAAKGLDAARRFYQEQINAGIQLAEISRLTGTKPLSLEALGGPYARYDGNPATMRPRSRAVRYTVNVYGMATRIDYLQSDAY